MKLSKIKALTLTFCAAFFCFAFAAIPVKAATAFDPYYYFWKYKDVACAYGYDPQALFNHYQTCGMAEGRFPNRQAEWREAAGHVDTAEERTAFLMTFPASGPADAEDTDLPMFDPIHYYNTYPDVAAVIGKDPVALLNHYFAYGFSEGREAFYGAEPCTEVQSHY